MAAPLNTVLPTLDMGVTSWTGTVGSWDENGGGTISYAWELRLVEDDSVVESGGGPSPSGTGTYNNANGYYLSVDATNTGGTTEARSNQPVGLGDEVAWYCPSISDSPNDLSGNGNNGTYQGGMGTVADTGEGGVRAYELDGVDDYIDLSGLQNNKSKYTVSLWFRDDGPSATAKVIFNIGESGGDRTANVGVTGTASNNIIAGHQRGGSIYYPQGGGSVNGVGWVHMAFSYETNGFIRIYKNAVEVASLGSVPLSDKGQQLAYVGRWVGATSYWFTGRIDDIRIYDRALTPAEITYLASQRGIEGSPGTPPTGTWHNPFRNSFFYNPFFDNEAL